jgi:predicted ATPase
VAWSEADMLPTINGQAHTRAVSGADLALVVLAFHYALLAMAVSDPRVNTNHPKILVIDEPEQQKMGKDRYNQVLQVFSQLAIAHKDQVQIIIATDSQDVPPELDEYAYALS